MSGPAILLARVKFPYHYWPCSLLWCGQCEYWPHRPEKDSPHQENALPQQATIYLSSSRHIPFCPGLSWCNIHQKKLLFPLFHLPKLPHPTPCYPHLSVPQSQAFFLSIWCSYGANPSTIPQICSETNILPVQIFKNAINVIISLNRLNDLRQSFNFRPVLFDFFTSPLSSHLKITLLIVVRGLSSIREIWDTLYRRLYMLMIVSLTPLFQNRNKCYLTVRNRYGRLATKFYLKTFCQGARI